MTAKSDVHGRYIITPPQMLERFLLMGSVGPTYKANDKFADYSAQDQTAVKTIFEVCPEQAIDVLTKVIVGRKAPRKPPVLLAIAAALTVDSLKARAEDLAKASVHIATDQFVLTKFILGYGRGKGRSFKRQANILYSRLDTPEHNRGRELLALNMVKYRSRADWSHRDLLRVSHYKPSKENNDLFRWVVGKGPAAHPLIQGYEHASSVTTEAQALDVLRQYPALPFEAFPTEVLKSHDLWEALLPNLGNSAIIRNLGRLSSLGVNLHPYEGDILEAAKNLHPVASLSAWRVYTKGRGEKGSLTWPVDKRVGEVLEQGFVQSFGQLKRSEAKVCFGLDVSGSMDTNSSTVAGLNCREVAAAMAMVAMKQQPYMVFGFGSTLTPLEIRDTWSLSQVIDYMKGIRFGSTDCSLPMRHCTANGFSDVDLFAIYTDNETNQRIKPSEALNTYRNNFNPNAKLATVALQGGAFSIADPSDPGQVDFIGFDPSVPSVMVSLAEQKLV